MGRIRVGISSWTEPTLVKSGWYPAAATTAEDRLRYYATKFSIVEVDSTFYAILNPRTAELWVERTPKNFTFNAKAYALLTQHPTPPARLPKDLREKVGDAKPNIYFKDRGFTYVVVDEPQGLASSVPPVVAVTAPLGMVRFHGHNRENWEKKGISTAEKFRYLYKRDELQAWAPRLQTMAGEATEVHAVMNNCYSDYAVRNAADLAELLD